MMLLTMMVVGGNDNSCNDDVANDDGEWLSLINQLY